MGLPPTTSKDSSDSSNIVTFNYQFPNFTGTHTGTTFALGTNSVAGGGTGDTSFTAYSPIVGGTTSTGALQSVSNVGATTGQFLTYQGSSSLPTWTSASGGSAFFAASSLVNTASTAITSTSPVIFNNSPAFTFTPTLSGTYKIYASMPVQVNSNALFGYVEILASSGSPAQISGNVGAVYSQTGDPIIDMVYCETVFTLNAGSPYTFDIYGYVMSGQAIGLRGDEGSFNMNAEQVATGTGANLVIGNIDGNGASSNGLSILTSTLYAQSASSSNPGMVNNTSQTFSGSKNFTSPIGYNNTTPAAATALDIINTTGSTQRIIQTGYSGNVGTRNRYANGSLGSPTAATSGNTLGFISGMGYGTTGFPASSTGAVNFNATATFTDSSMPTSVSINTTPSGSITSATVATFNPNGQLTLPAFYTSYGAVVNDSSGNLTTATPGTSGNILFSNGASSLPTFQSQSNITSVGTITTGVWNGTVTAGQTVLTSGTTYTTPAGVTTATRFKFTLVGGGGGGGGINTASAKGSGGGGGGTVIIYAVGLSPSTGYTIAIGSAGAGGISTTTPATAGGITTISLDSITYTAGGGGLGASAIDSAGGAGGTATNVFGTGFSQAGLNIPGQAGAASGAATADAPWGAGGHSGMHMGSGGPAVAGNVTSNGNPGTGYGGGGSGANGGSGPTGGAGTGGIIIVEWNN